MPEGSWKCEKCNNINYPFRTKCNRQNCGADKPAESKKSPSPAPDENDQVCCIRHLLSISIGCLESSLFLVICVHVTNLICIIFSEIYVLMDQFLRFPSMLDLFFHCRWILILAL